MFRNLTLIDQSTFAKTFKKLKYIQGTRMVNTFSRGYQEQSKKNYGFKRQTRDHHAKLHTFFQVKRISSFPERKVLIEKIFSCQVIILSNVKKVYLDWPPIRLSRTLNRNYHLLTKSN